MDSVRQREQGGAASPGIAGAGLDVTNSAVAPFNPNLRWPQGYFQVLEEMGVPERRRGFYAHWVRQFFNRCLGNRPASQGSCTAARRRRDLGRQDMEEFLAALARQEGVADWQAIQAR